MSAATIAGVVKPGVRSVEAEVSYTPSMSVKPRYHANDSSRDNFRPDRRRVAIEDARTWPTAPTLESEGFQLVRHVSKVKDFHDAAEVARVYPSEIEQLLLDLTGADCVGIASSGLGGPGLVRYSERSPAFGRVANAGPARLVHIDPSEATAKFLMKNALPKGVDRPIRRACYFNVWRAVTPPPQDVPLAVCAAGSFSQGDLRAADAIFDTGEQPWFTLEAFLMQYNPDASWAYFSDMTRDEVLVFKANDSDPSRTHNVPHTGFDDPSCPPGVPGRESIETRGCAYWFD